MSTFDKTDAESTMNSSTLEREWLKAISPEDFIQNNRNFNMLMMRYKSATKEIQTKLEILNEEFTVTNQRNPISSIKTRVKSPSSIYEKLKRKGFEFTEESIMKNLDDVAGIRIVCPFVSDIYTLADMIGSQDDLTVLKVKDYIQNPKPNGYRSYHMIIEIPVFFAEGKVPLRAELQIRTMGMDFWASLDHQLHYKKNYGGNDISYIENELLNCAHTMNDLDQHMEAIKNLIGTFVIE